MAQPRPAPAGHPTDRLLGRSPALSALRSQIRHLAAFDTVGSPHAPTVLLQGETGTGKGLVARVIHDSGPRAQGPFIDVNCAAIPETLLEAELFGFEAGTFTDAKRAKPGLLEAASGGTLFLDEIEALPLTLQSKFLKAIEDKWVRRLGAVRGQAVDVKIIAATTADLGGYAAQGRFRSDLYHPLAVVVVTLPPVSAEALVQSLLGEDPSLAPLTTLLIARTGGNPFFLEESVRTLVETGGLVGAPGAYRLAQALPSLQVPATVQAVLAARLDRLPPEEKRLLQTAAVIGTEVPLPLLQAIAELPEDALHCGLAHLQAAEFLYETRLFPEREYTFTHALTQQVAYHSLLRERRRGLHARLVEALETLAPERVTEQVERLAHHAL